MRTYTFRRFMVGWLWVCLAGWAQAQPVQPVPKTTAYTREFLTNSTAADARAKLGLAGTNVGYFVGFNPTQFATNGDAIDVIEGAVLTNTVLRGAVDLKTAGGVNADLQVHNVSDEATIQLLPDLPGGAVQGTVLAGRFLLNATNDPEALDLVYRDWVLARTGAPATNSSGGPSVGFTSINLADETGNYGVIWTTNAAGVVTFQRQDGTNYMTFGNTNDLVTFNVPVAAPLYYGDGSELTNLVAASSLLATNTAVLVVRTNGNDTTAQRGLAEYPYRTIAAALSNAVAGDSVWIAAGTHSVTQTCIVAAGVTMAGEPGSLILDAGPTYPAGAYQVFDLNSNVTLRNLRLGRFWTNFVAGPIFLEARNLATNVLVQNCEFIGGMDNASFVVTNTALADTKWLDITFEDCRFFSTYDSMIVQNGSVPTAYAKLTFRRCSWEHHDIGAAADAGFPMAGVQFLNGTNNSVLFDRCSFLRSGTNVSLWMPFCDVSQPGTATFVQTYFSEDWAPHDPLENVVSESLIRFDLMTGGAVTNGTGKTNVIGANVWTGPIVARGSITATNGFHGPAPGLSNMNASALSSGTVPSARMPLVFGGISNALTHSTLGTNVLVEDLKTVIQNGGANTLVVTNGRVGIGISSPSQPLQVNGTINATTVSATTVSASTLAAGAGSVFRLSYGASGGLLDVWTGSAYNTAMIVNSNRQIFADTLTSTNTITASNFVATASPGFTGDGSETTNLNASNLASGTVSPARMATNAASAGYTLVATSPTTAAWAGASWTPVNLASMGTNVFVSPTNGNLQRYTLTNATWFTVLDLNTNNTETIRLELTGSNYVSWSAANLSNSVVLYPTNRISVLLLDRAAGTNLWWGSRIR